MTVVVSAAVGAPAVGEGAPLGTADEERYVRMYRISQYASA
jgi:hypothetical protein